MSAIKLCRLCICPFLDCKKLFDENGQCNEAYDIASKYFDPMVRTYNCRRQFWQLNKTFIISV